MAQFQRDTRISNITLDEGALVEVFDVFRKRADALGSSPHDDEGAGSVYAFIRFDGKGYGVVTCEELLHYFRRSVSVESIFVGFQTARASSSGRSEGSHIQLQLERDDPVSCYLRVFSDNREWLDASFCAIEESLDKFKNRHGWLRSNSFGLLIQLSGVALGFLISLWAAVVVSPNIPMESAFVIVFLFVLLLFSNVWDYIKNLLFQAANGFFPNVLFFRPEKDRYRWLKQTVIGAIVVAIH